MISVNIKFVFDCGSFGTVERKYFSGNWKELRQLIKEADASFVLFERITVHNIHDLAGMLEHAWYKSGGNNERCVRYFCKMSGWNKKAAPMKYICSQLSAEAAVDGRGYFLALLREAM